MKVLTNAVVGIEAKLEDKAVALTVDNMEQFAADIASAASPLEMAELFFNLALMMENKKAVVNETCMSGIFSEKAVDEIVDTLTDLIERIKAEE